MEISDVSVDAAATADYSSENKTNRCFRKYYFYSSFGAFFVKQQPSAFHIVKEPEWLFCTTEAPL